MGTFLSLQEKARKLTPQRVRSDLFKFIRTIEEEFAQLNVNQLHNLSQDVFGNPIGFYSKKTEEITEGRKQEGQPFNLYETGEFLEKLFARVERNSIFFDTSDSKKPEVLMNLLSKDIFGLTDEQLNKVIREYILPYFLEYYPKQLGL